ncbi:MAG: hypothetical protein ACM30H_03775 [Clostridia bacterium]
MHRFLAAACIGLAGCASRQPAIDPPYTLRDAQGFPIQEKKSRAVVVDRYILTPSASAGASAPSTSTAVIPVDPDAE